MRLHKLSNLVTPTVNNVEKALHLHKKVKVQSTFAQAKARPVSLSAQALSSAPDAIPGLVTGAYSTLLGRAPDAAGFAYWNQQATSWKALGASDTDIENKLSVAFSASNEAISKSVNAQYQALLGRDADPEGLAAFSASVKQQLSEGKSPAEAAGNVANMIKTSEEYRGAHLSDLVESVYNEVLGRPSDVSGLQGWTEVAQGMREQGALAAEIKNTLVARFMESPEYLSTHAPVPPPPLQAGVRNSNRDDIYLEQPNGWTCGPTSVTMAMAAFGLRPANGETLNEMTDALGASPGTGVPGGVDYVANVARNLGLQADASQSQSAGDMRAELEAGRGVMVNGGLSTGGHFVYLAGIDENNNFIVCDPFRPGITRWNDGELEAFCHSGNHPPGYVAVNG
jgi:Peptidase_C39 like family